MTHERALAVVAAVDLGKREKRTAKALLAVEAASARGHRQAIRNATASLVTAATVGADPVTHIRRGTLALQNDLRHEAVANLRAARNLGRERLVDEIGPLPHTLASALDAAGVDEASAMVSSAGLAAAWGGAALAIAAQDGTPREFAGLVRTVDGRMTRTVATETARAFNDERNAILIAIGDQHDLHGEAGRGQHDAGDHPPPGIFKVFSAILDRATCAECMGADGEIAEPSASFKAGTPPLHPHCRCIVEHVVIAKTERIEDIGIDYALFKDELRDVIRENRIVSDRRALAFIADSLGAKRSPEVLARRFREEKYATNAQPTVGFRRKPKPIPKGTP